MDFVSYLEDLPASAVRELYSSPWTCRAVLRSLPPLAKQYVMRLAFLDENLSDGVLHCWPSKLAQSQHAAAVRKLGELSLLLKSPQEDAVIALPQSARAEGLNFQLHPEMQRQLRLMLASGIIGQAQHVPQDVIDSAPSPEQQDRHVQSQWEGLLSYLTGSTGRPPGASFAGPRPRLRLLDLLQAASLRPAGKQDLTAAGYSFILMDTYHQLWQLLRAYIDLARKQSGAELASVLSFLLQLGGQPLAQPLSLDSLQPGERDICADLALLGLLLPFATPSGHIWASPTRLALALGGGNSAEVQQEVIQGYIIVETNYRLYAYTQSPLQRSVLDLFVRCEAVLPNLYIGTLTRDSVSAALGKGLEVEQLLTFLRRHAHPRAMQRSPAVPEVVGDQMRLWQTQMQRLRSTSAVLYQSFIDVATWQASVNQARQLGVWLFDNERSLQLVARAEGHDQMRSFIKSLRKS